MKKETTPLFLFQLERVTFTNFVILQDPHIPMDELNKAMKMIRSLPVKLLT